MRTVLLPTIVVALASPARSDVAVLDEAQFLTKLGADPRLVRIAANVDLARADVTAAGIRPNPTIGYEREEVFPDGGLATNYLRLTLPLEISGRRGARVDAARAEVIAIAAEGDAERFAITIEALRTFRTAAYERARIDILRAERASLVKAVEVVRKRTGSGAASGYDLQRVELELAAYDDLIADAETRLAGARLELGTLAGLPDGIDAATPLDIPADPPALDALGLALEKRPDYRAALARREAGRALDRAGSRGWVPDLTLGGGVMRQDLGDTSANGYTAGIALTVPLFDHGQADRARAAAQRRLAEAEQRHIERVVPAAVRRRHLALVQTIVRARTLVQSQLGRLDQLLRSAEAGYREANGNIVELLDAYTTARDTRLRDLELRRDARFAELELWLALGRRP